jgi:hypothetical protein
VRRLAAALVKHKTHDLKIPGNAATRALMPIVFPLAPGA